MNGLMQGTGLRYGWEIGDMGHFEQAGESGVAGDPKMGAQRDSELRAVSLPGHCIRVIGEVCLGTRSQWETILDSVEGNGFSGRMDLSELSSIDVNGAATLVATAHRMAPHKQLVLTAPPPYLLRMLDFFWPGDESGIRTEGDAPR